MSKRTKNCPYCEGEGTRTKDRSTFACWDCDGTGRRCILCCLSEVNCQCPLSAFDGDYSEMDRPSPA